MRDASPRAFWDDAGIAPQEGGWGGVPNGALMTELSTLTVLVTGATDGLGRALAGDLAEAGHRVILHGRSAERLEATAAEVAERATGPKPATVQADLAALASVRRIGEQVAALTDRLDVLVSNAGIGSGEPDSPHRQESADGHELRFAVNYLAGFDLTLQLLPLLRAAGATPAARIVYVASLGQAPIDFDDVMIERDYSGSRAYGQSKLAQITTGFRLAERLRPEGIAVNSLHPATYMPTKIVLSVIGRSVDRLETGVAATRRLVDDPALNGTTGLFFDRAEETLAHPSAYETDVQNRLWKLSLDLTGASDPFGP
jgi:NAD(P)-dependent dehydrogenase (short-subunit alcohol dehydrogenase family)